MAFTPESSGDKLTCDNLLIDPKTSGNTLTITVKDGAELITAD